MHQEGPKDCVLLHEGRRQASSAENLASPRVSIMEAILIREEYLPHSRQLEQNE